MSKWWHVQILIANTSRFIKLIQIFKRTLILKWCCSKHNQNDISKHIRLSKSRNKDDNYQTSIFDNIHIIICRLKNHNQTKIENHAIFEKSLSMTFFLYSISKFDNIVIECLMIKMMLFDSEIETKKHESFITNVNFLNFTFEQKMLVNIVKWLKNQNSSVKRESNQISNLSNMRKYQNVKSTIESNSDSEIENMSIKTSRKNNWIKANSTISVLTNSQSRFEWQNYYCYCVFVCLFCIDISQNIQDIDVRKSSFDMTFVRLIALSEHLKIFLIKWRKEWKWRKKIRKMTRRNYYTCSKMKYTLYNYDRLRIHCCRASYHSIFVQRFDITNNDNDKTNRV